MKTKVLYGVIAALLIIMVGGGVYGYREYTKLKDENVRLMNPEESAKAEIDRIRSQVEKLVDTPKDEMPIIATVTDLEKLKSQSFYANAQNGDKALFYEKSKRAILYRPSTNKIINTSTIDIKSPAPAAQTAPAADPGAASGPQTQPPADDGVETVAP